MTNGTVTKYIRGLQLISSKTGSSESFYNFNGHGDVMQLTNGSGSITKQYSYDAFGVEQNKADNDMNPFRYCGEYFDTEADSVYLRARYYSPVSGRFISEDPIRDGENWYLYSIGNPVKFIDYNGLETVIINDGLFSKSIYGNVSEKATGIYANMRNIVTNAGGKVDWKSKAQGGIATVSFKNSNQQYKIEIEFDSLEVNTYASAVRVYKNGKRVYSGDPVVDALNTQDAYFFIEKGEYEDDSVRVQAKASTMFWIMEKNTMFQYFYAAYDIARLVNERHPSISKQEVLDYLGNQPLIEFSADYWAPGYLDALAEAERGRGDGSGTRGRFYRHTLRT